MLNSIKKITLATALSVMTIVPASAETGALTQNATPAEYLAVVDALHRFTWGMDMDNAELLGSAFAEDGTADFSYAAKTLGIAFPPITGRGNIEKGLGGFASGLVTSHVVADARVNVDGDTALLYAIVEAQHRPLKDRSRNLLLSNAYTVKLVRRGDVWLIQNMAVENLWSQGDIKVATGE
jgi:ketosteroid isomerase-like protein